MNPHDGPAISQAALWQALQRFGSSPGSHGVAHGEPRILFEQVLPVLMLANRSTERAEDAAPPAAVRRGARLFVRHALFRPSNDHYGLMGIAPEADAATLRQHYRLLIRLTHPDRSHETGPWPEDAAARVNQAYEVLSSPDKRAKYDEQRMRASESLPVPAKGAPAVATSRERPSRQFVLGAAASLAMAALGALTWLGSDPVDASLEIVAGAQRPSIPSSPSFHPLDLQVAAEGRTRVLSAAPAARLSIELAPTVAVGAAEEPGSPQHVAAGALSRPTATRIGPVDVGTPGTAAHPAVGAPVPQHLPPQRTAAAAPVDFPAPLLTPPAEESRPGPIASATTTRTANDLPGIEGLSLALTQTLPAGAQVPQAKAREGTHSDATANANAMARLQPLLADLLQTLESGQTEQVHQWAVRRTRDDASAARFAAAYRAVLDGRMVASLGPARFSLDRTPERQVVHGAVQMRLQDDRQQARWTSFGLRAHFVTRDDTVQLIRLDAE